MPLPELAQIIESNRKTACKSLTITLARHREASDGGFGQERSLYGPNGERKYLNQEERRRALAVMQTLDPARSLFSLVLAWTGARLSEVLALSAQSFQIETGVVSIVTLKRRKHTVREVLIPDWLMAKLDHHFRLRQHQQGTAADQRLWPWHSVTAWRLIKKVMKLARITGIRACPRGLRHAFGVATLQGGTPLNLIQRWMGHARLSTTAIYASVSGPEERYFAEKFWRFATTGFSPPTHELAECA